MENIKLEIKKCINDLKSKDTFYKQIPNLLTLSRIIGIIPINILFFTGQFIPLIIVSSLVFLTDFMDGKIARKYNISSEFGAKLDAVCDKVMAIGLMIPLLFNLPIILANIMLELGISFVNLYASKKGVDVKTLTIGKVKTWFLSLTLGAGYLALFNVVTNIVFYLVMFITASIQAVTVDKYVDNYYDLLEIKKKDMCNSIENENTMDVTKTISNVNTYNNIENNNTYENDVNYNENKVKKRVRKIGK